MRTMAQKRYNPSRDRQKLDRLEEEFANILQSFSAHEPLVKGNFQNLRRRCGKTGCRCERGKLHESFVFIDRSSGKRRIRKTTVAQEKKLRKPVQKDQLLRKLRARLSKLHSETLACCDRLREHRLNQGKRLLSQSKPE